jgi:DNA-directed RNA polymerase beta' subunit
MTDSKMRNLTNTEIEYIIDFIKPNKYIPEETANSIVEMHKEKLRNQLKSQKLYKKYIKSDIEKIKEIVSKEYHKSKIQPGESVGIITAQCIGEMTTQNTLNSFHKAGLTEKTTVTGVPRFEELLNTTHNPKGVSCSVYFTKGTESIQSLRKVIGHDIVEITFDKISTSIEVCMNKKSETWYLPYSIIYGDEFMKHKHCLSIKLNTNILYEYFITMHDIIDKIHSLYGDLHCVCSPNNIGQLDIFIDTSNIEIDDEYIFGKENKSYLNEDNKEELYIDEVVKVELEKLKLFGIQGITNIFYINRDGEWMIETEGSNFLEILALPFVDYTRTVSNDIWDMFNILGIEAAKHSLFDELHNIMSNINKCHIKLLVDKMTFSGTICSISRYAMKKEEAGPMSKASFEQSLENFLNAAAFGEKENTRGVSASIICGKKAKIGSGLCDLGVDIDKLISS